MDFEFLYPNTNPDILLHTITDFAVTMLIHVLPLKMRKLKKTHPDYIMYTTFYADFKKKMMKEGFIAEEHNQGLIQMVFHLINHMFRFTERKKPEACADVPLPNPKKKRLESNPKKKRAAAAAKEKPKAKTNLFPVSPDPASR